MGGHVNGPPNRATPPKAWPKRRQWRDRIDKDSRLTTGCKAWLGVLASRSDDAGKPCWGNQVKMADQLGRSDRSVRRYLVEAVALGYVRVFRSEPERGRNGRWCRRKANTYYLCLPNRDTATKPAPRRTQRAPYCVATTGRPHRRHLPDSDGRSSPFGVRQPPPHPPWSDENEDVTHPNTSSPPRQPGDRAADFAALRQLLKPTLKLRR